MADDPDVAAWRALLVAYSRLVPAVEAELRAAGQVSLGQQVVLSRTQLTPEQCLELASLLEQAARGTQVSLSR